MGKSTAEKRAAEKKAAAKVAAEMEAAENEDTGSDFETFVRVTLKSLATKVDNLITKHDTLQGQLTSMDNRVTANTTSITDLGNSIDFQSDRIDDNVTNTTNIKADVTQMSINLEAACGKIQNLEREVTGLERYTRSFNARFVGVDESEGENCRDTVHELLSTHLDIDDEVLENAHRIGPKKPGTPRHIIARFFSRAKRREAIIASRSVNPAPFRIIDDLCKSDADEKKRVAPYMGALFHQGIRPQFRNGRLYVGREAVAKETIANFLKQKAETDAAAAATTAAQDEQQKSNVASGVN